MADGEREALYALRARVFLGESILRPSGATLLSDDWDEHPASTNLVAVAGGRVVGGCRGTMTTHGIDAAVSPLFDFRPHLGRDRRLVCLGSWLCLDPDHRGRTTGLRLVKAVSALASEAGMQTYCAAVRPDARPLFLRLGWHDLGPPFRHPVADIGVQPMARRADSTTINGGNQ
ncbi:MAG: GNAT family N-acetyltransferase [Actinomycetota bacterium]